MNIYKALLTPASESAAAGTQPAKCVRFRRDLIWAGVQYPPKSLGQFLTNLGQSQTFWGRHCHQITYKMWHCPCLGCPKWGKLSQMGQLAAHLGQDLGCPDYLVNAHATLCTLGRYHKSWWKNCKHRFGNHYTIHLWQHNAMSKCKLKGINIGTHRFFFLWSVKDYYQFQSEKSIEKNPTPSLQQPAQQSHGI